MKNLYRDLIEKIDGDILTDEFSLGMYSTDASIYQIKPLAIVLPKSVNDVKFVIQFAYNNNITILPRGARTSLAGQTVGESIILDFSKYMNHILEIDTKEKWVRVQPGMAFGYGKEHFDLSKKIGEEILFPAINKVPKKMTWLRVVLVVGIK